MRPGTCWSLYKTKESYVTTYYLRFVYGRPDGDDIKKSRLGFHVRKTFRVCHLEHEAWTYVISFCLKLDEDKVLCMEIII